MKKLLSSKILNWILVAVIVALALKFGNDHFQWTTRWDVARAVDDILMEHETAKARQALRDAGNRGMVIEELKDALESDKGTVKGKIEIIRTLNSWREVRVARRALHSSNLDTRRAAAWFYHGSEANREEVEGIVLDWLGDEKAAGRSMAAQLVGQLKIEEAVPVLMEALDRGASTREETNFLVGAMSTLANLKPEGLGPKILKIAKDTSIDIDLRRMAFMHLGRMEDVPRDEVQQLMLSTLANAKSGNLLRTHAAGALANKEFANEEVWKALEKALFAPGGDQIVQRSCLRTMGETAPLDRVRRLLLDRRVYSHPYFAIRVDVAAGLAALEVKERIALDLLTDFLADEDSTDTQFLVRQEGWLSLWTLSRRVILPDKYGDSKKLFSNPPGAFKDEARIRESLFKPSFTRAGVTKLMVDALKPVASNLDDMKRIRQVFNQQKDDIVATWK
jgi:HEAT repeat protein